MERNPIWLVPALVALAAVGGAAGWTALTAGPSGPTPEQLEQQRRQSRTQALLSQMQVDQYQPLLIASIPIMGALGAFLLWKKRQQEEE